MGNSFKEKEINKQEYTMVSSLGGNVKKQSRLLLSSLLPFLYCYVPNSGIYVSIVHVAKVIYNLNTIIIVVQN